MMNIFLNLAMYLIPFFCVLVPILLGQQYGFYLKTKAVKVSDAPVEGDVEAASGDESGKTLKPIGDEIDPVVEGNVGLEIDGVVMIVGSLENEKMHPLKSPAYAAAAVPNWRRLERHRVERADLRACTRARRHCALASLSVDTGSGSGSGNMPSSSSALATSARRTRVRGSGPALLALSASPKRVSSGSRLLGS